MAIALMGAGFSATDTSDAVNILYPITMTVQANKAWQASGLIVTGRQVTQVTAQGSWTANPDLGMWGPAGQSGSFELCINDDLNSRYGPGLRNNIGMLTVLLQTLAR